MAALRWADQRWVVQQWVVQPWVGLVLLYQEGERQLQILLTQTLAQLWLWIHRFISMTTEDQLVLEDKLKQSKRLILQAWYRKFYLSRVKTRSL